MPASEKLSHLQQLASQGPALRAGLAEEVAELLAAWPPDYPDSMRVICEGLLADAARDLDGLTRARLRVQLHQQPDLVQRLLPREPVSWVLVEAARAGENLPATLAQSLRVHEKTALQILGDETGAALAVACKAAHIDRAAFSALALLAHPARNRSHAFAMLNGFDDVPMSEASRVLRGWQENQAA